MKPTTPTQAEPQEHPKPAAVGIQINRCPVDRELRAAVLPLGHGVTPSTAFFTEASLEARAEARTTNPG